MDLNDSFPRPLNIAFDQNTAVSRSVDHAAAAVDADPVRMHPGAADYAGYGTDPNRDSDALDYLRVLSKHKWTALTSFVLVVLATAVYTFTATPQYDATVQLLIENQDPKVVSFQEVLEQSQRANDYYLTQYKILESRALARRTLDGLTLWNHPQFADPTGVTAAIAARVRSWIATPHPQSQSAAETMAQSQSIDRFLDNLTVSPVRNSRLVNVTFRSPDALMAARVANAVSDNYIQDNLQTRLDSSKQASDWLGEQLAEQRKKVETSERALQRYREQNDAVSLEDRQNIVVQKLSDVNAAVTRARTDRIQKEAAYDQIRALQGNRSTLDTLPAIVSNTFVQQQKTQLSELQRQQAQLAEKLGPRHPDMLKVGVAIQSVQARIDAEIAKVVESLRNDYQQALAQERNLTSALDQQKREALELNRKGIDYGVLSRDATTNRQMFDTLMQRMKETGVSSELRTNNIRIVDPAEVPRKPSSPRTAVNLVASLLGGSVLGIGFAFLFEYLDNRIKNPDEIKEVLRLPFLGMVPALPASATKDAGAQGKSPLINDGVPPDFAESFRALRTNLLFSSADEGSRTVVITRTGPGEGKTLVASNVAMALAMASERVLLIDGDMRRPRVHEVFRRSQHPGLSNVLVGTATIEGSMFKTSVPGLWVMPAGEHPPNPAELLGSKRCKELLASLSERFEWIVLDTPPVMAATDASIVAHGATGVLFVVGSEMTARGAAQRALEQLWHARAKIMGAVLNRVDLRGNSLYYSHYYRREYSDYHRPQAL